METLLAFDMVLLSLKRVIIRKLGMMKDGIEDELGLYIFSVVSCVLNRSSSSYWCNEALHQIKWIAIRQIAVAWINRCP